MPSRPRSRRALGAVLLAALVVLVGAITGAAAPQPGISAVVAGPTAGHVRLTVDVPSRAGAVPGPEAFSVSVRGAPLPVRAEPVLSGRLAMGLVVDASEAGSAVLQSGLSGLADFALALAPTTRSVLVTDTTPPRLLAPLTVGPTGIVEALNTVQAGGARQTAVALQQAVQQLPTDPTEPRLLVLYTSAADAGEPAADLVARLNAAGVVLAVVGVLTAEQAALDYWARASAGTGGVAVNAAPTEIMPAFESLAATLRNRFLLSIQEPSALPAQLAVRAETSSGPLTTSVLVPAPARLRIASSPPILVALGALLIVLLATGAVAVVRLRSEKASGWGRLAPRDAQPPTPAAADARDAQPPTPAAADARSRPSRASSPPAPAPRPAAAPRPVPSPRPVPAPNGVGTPWPATPPPSPARPPGTAPDGAPPPRPTPTGGPTSSHADAEPPVPASTAPPRTTWNLPAPLSQVLVREELLAQLAATVAAGGPALLRDVDGGIGTGASTAMIEFAHLHHADYDIAWWVPAQDPDLIPDRLAELAEVLGLARPSDPAEQAMARLFAALRERDRWLLAFDDADSPHAVARFLPEGPGHTMITSPDPSWADVATTVAVPAFSRAESVALLTARHCEPEDSAQLAAVLEDRPVAIDLAGALLAETGMDVDTFLGCLAERRAVGDDPSIATWQVAFDRLAHDDKTAFALLTMVAWLGAAPVPLTLLLEHPDIGPAFGTDPDDFVERLAVLHHRGMAQVSADAVQLHRMPAALLVNRTGADQGWAARAVRLLRAAAPEPPSYDSATWPAWRRLLPHVLTTTDPARALDEVAVEVVWLLGRAGSYLAARGQPRAARALLEDAYELGRRRLGEQHPETVASAQELAADLHELGMHDQARALLQA